MISNKKVLAFIPARAGSKGIKDKNIVDLGGKPLISYTINSALKSKYIDKVLVSTDGEKIANVAREYGAQVPFMRPEEIAGDRENIITAITYTIEKLKNMGEEYDLFILLQPTSPFRNENHIDEALEIMINNHLPSLLSVCETDKNATLIRKIDENKKLTPIIETNICLRQQMDKYYILNGAIYINYTKDINENTLLKDNEYGYIMDKYHSIDIDEPIDIDIANLYIEKKMV